MKLIFTISSILLLSLTVSAQISITSSQGYFPGDGYYFQPCNSSGANLGAAGENVTVSLPSLQRIGFANSRPFKSPSETSFDSIFPEATVASPLGGDAYTYYKVSESKQELLGTGMSNSILKYSNPMTMILFPMHYGDSIGDEYAASYNQDSFDVHRGGTISIVADAWGNITTPAGTFPYLRLKVYQYTLDTFYKLGQNTGITTTETFTYHYIGTNSKAPLYSYNEVYSGGSYMQSAFYAVNVTNTSIYESAEQESASVYPNPVSAELNVNFTLKQSSNVSIRVVDMTGKEVATMADSFFKAGKHILSVNIETLPTGMYAAIIIADGTRQKVKFIVE